MLVYTVHPVHHYKRLLEQGYLEGVERHAMFPESYRWMMGQMAERIPGYDGETYPMWVWKRPKGLGQAALGKRGSRCVMLTLDVPEEQILWSSFGDWHMVLNNGPVTFDEEEWESFGRYRDRDMERVRASWPRIFDEAWLRSRPDDWASQNYEWQGVTPRITADMVRRVQRFIAK